MKGAEGGQKYKITENEQRGRCKERAANNYERNERINGRENFSSMNLRSLCTSRA